MSENEAIHPVNRERNNVRELWWEIYGIEKDEPRCNGAAEVVI